MNAQTIHQSRFLDADSVFSTKLTGETFIEKRYKGDPFFTNDWVKGAVLLTSGDTVSGKRIKYNGLLDEIIWLNPFNLRKVKLDKSYISEFWYKNIQGKTIHFKRINVNDLSAVQQPAIFVEVALEGKVSLYIQHKFRVFDTENFYEDAKQYSIELIEPSTMYYIKLPSNKYIVAKSIKRNTLLNLFPEQKKDIVKLLKLNHLNFKSESSIIKVIDKLNKELFVK